MMNAVKICLFFTLVAVLNTAVYSKVHSIRPPGTSPCATILCGFGKICVARNGKAKCECNEVCLEIYEPVCGTDGVTYSNLCSLNVADCKSKKEIRAAHPGPCDYILEQRCPNASPTACFAPCPVDECKKRGEICCCSLIDDCEGCTTPVNNNGVLGCPPVRNGCKDDDECEGHEECCATGCTRICMPKGKGK